MTECEFIIKDLASNRYYKLYKPHNNNTWLLFNEEGEGMEISPDSLYSMIDKHFKENF